MGQTVDRITIPHLPAPHVEFFTGFTGEPRDIRARRFDFRAEVQPDIFHRRRLVGVAIPTAVLVQKFQV